MIQVTSKQCSCFCDRYFDCRCGILSNECDEKGIDVMPHFYNVIEMIGFSTFIVKVIAFLNLVYSP